MIEAYDIVNVKMCQEDLPYVDYRISTDNGTIMRAKSLNS